MPISPVSKCLLTGYQRAVRALTSSAFSASRMPSQTGRYHPGFKWGVRSIRITGRISSQARERASSVLFHASLAGHCAACTEGCRLLEKLVHKCPDAPVFKEWPCYAAPGTQAGTISAPYGEAGAVRA